MPNRLPVPEELLHLIEKRDVDSAERGERRCDVQRRETDLGPVGAVESIADLDDLPLEDRRSEAERRVAGQRRSET